MWFKTTDMKIKFSIFSAIAVILIASGTYAQSLPEVSFRDYGYTKPVKKVTQIYFSIDYANDGSIKSVEEVEKVIQSFNKDGNIESYENQSFLDDSWAKSNSIYINGRLAKQIWTHSNPILNRTYTYIYDKQGKIIEEKIRFKDGSKSLIKFRYKDSLLSEIDADRHGTQSLTQRFYSISGKLYKEIHRQKVPNEADIVTNYFYLEDKEILSYVEPHNYFYATAYLKDAMGNHSVEIKFKLIEDSIAQEKLLKGISRYDKEAPSDNVPFNLQEYSAQTLQAYTKNKNELKPFRIVLYLRDENNNITAEAEVDVKSKNIVGIGFFQTEYADGTTTGTTEFIHKKLHLFEAMLHQMKLP